MKHLVIFTLVLNLLAGTVVFLYAYSAWRRRRQVFLKVLLAYILSFNSLNIADFSYQYARANVFSNDASLVLEQPFLCLFLLFLVYCAEFSITASLLCLVERLKGRKVSGSIGWFLVLWAVIFGSASGYGLLLLFRDANWQFFYWVHAGWVFSMILIIIAELISSLVFSFRRDYDRNSIRPFLWFFLAGYGLFGIFNLDFYLSQSVVLKYVDPAMLLLVNLCPLIWLKFFYERDHSVGETAQGEKEKLAGFCREFNISNRERQIIEQVMRGRSNKEIEDRLFISFNTVKNHLYNIFQKTEVASRSELIHRISHYRE